MTFSKKKKTQKQQRVISHPLKYTYTDVVLMHAFLRRHTQYGLQCIMHLRESI